MYTGCARRLCVDPGCAGRLHVHWVCQETLRGPWVCWETACTLGVPGDLHAGRIKDTLELSATGVICDIGIVGYCLNSDDAN